MNWRAVLTSPLGFLIGLSLGALGGGGSILAVPALLEGHRPAAVLADRAYDAGSLRRHLDQIGAVAVIPSTRSRKVPIPHDPLIYKLRNRIERCFNRLKHFRRFATRYERRTIHFTGFIHLAAITIWLS